jgi:archaeal flagellar protein FlaJ
MMLFQTIARKIPGLQLKLRQAGLYDEPEHYVQRIFFTSFMLSFGLALVVFTFLSSLTAFLFIPIFFPMLFLYFVKYVDLKIDKISKRIDQEIVFAGRFIIIEIESGVPIYKVFEEVEKNYDVIGFYFGEIVDRVYLGTSMEDAINETLLITPSANLRRLLWQVLNSMKTGTDVGPSLNSVIDQIVREQDISVKEYGKKLSPIAMFYMMVSIIIPSLGITMLVILATFMGLKITMPFFIVLACMIGFVQFIFLSIIRSARPAISN